MKEREESAPDIVFASIAVFQRESRPAYLAIVLGPTSLITAVVGSDTRCRVCHIWSQHRREVAGAPAKYRLPYGMLAYW